MINAGAAVLVDAMFTVGINAFLKYQEGKAVIALAQAENRKLSPEELAGIQKSRDDVMDETEKVLDEAIAKAAAREQN